MLKRPAGEVLRRVVAVAALAAASFGLAEVVVALAAGGWIPLALGLFWAAWYAALFLPVAATVALSWRVATGRHATAAELGGATCAVGFTVVGSLVAMQELWPAQSLLHGPRLLAVPVMAVGALVAAASGFLPMQPQPVGRAGIAARFVLPVAWMLGMQTGVRADGGLPTLLLGAVAATTAAGVAVRVLSRKPRLMWAAGVLLALSTAALYEARRPRVIRRDSPRTALSVAATRNVLLIVLDTVRARNLGCYGYDRDTTPNIDRFARDATLFSRCTTPGPWSLPAHASLFTGLYPSRHEAREHLNDDGEHTFEPLRGEFETMAEILANAGYETAAISANTAVVGGRTGLSQGFSHFDARPRAAPRVAPFWDRLSHRLPRALLLDPLNELFHPNPPGASVTRRALEWLEARPRGRPFFLFLNYMDTHHPCRGWRDVDSFRSHESPDLPAHQLPLATRRALSRGQRGLTDAERTHLHAIYDRGLRSLDNHVGSLLQALQNEGSYEDTTVIVTADHGEALGEHGVLGHHATLQEEVLHVPLIVRRPGRPGPRVDPRPTQLVDILPTVLGDLGLRTSGRPDGISLDQPREYMYAEGLVSVVPGPGRSRAAFPAATVIHNQLKYISAEGQPPRMFDLAADPSETRDVLPTRAQDGQRLGEVLQRWKQSFPAPSRPASPDDREELRALGYVY